MGKASLTRTTVLLSDYGLGAGSLISLDNYIRCGAGPSAWHPNVDPPVNGALLRTPGSDQSARRAYAKASLHCDRLRWPRRVRRRRRRRLAAPAQDCVGWGVSSSWPAGKGLASSSRLRCDHGLTAACMTWRYQRTSRSMTGETREADSADPQ